MFSIIAIIHDIEKKQLNIISQRFNDPQSCLQYESNLETFSSKDLAQNFVGSTLQTVGPSMGNPSPSQCPTAVHEVSPVFICKS